MSSHGDDSIRKLNRHRPQFQPVDLGTILVSKKVGPISDSIMNAGARAIFVARKSWFVTTHVAPHGGVQCAKRKTSSNRCTRIFFDDLVVRQHVHWIGVVFRHMFHEAALISFDKRKKDFDPSSEYTRVPKGRLVVMHVLDQS